MPKAAYAGWRKGAGHGAQASAATATVTKKAILRGADDSRLAWHYIAPGAPTQNTFLVIFGCPTSICIPALARAAYAKSSEAIARESLLP